MTDENTPSPLADHVQTIDIGVPVERVWEEITKTGQIQKALFNTVLETQLQPGAKMRYYSPDKKRVFVVGEIVEVNPPNRLVHTYMFVQRPETPTLVTWELTPTDDGCRVTLTHTGFTDQEATHKGVGKGWAQILGILKQDLETGDISFGTKVLYWLMGTFSFMAPKATKVEEVDKTEW